MSSARKISPSMLVDLRKVREKAPYAEPLELFDVFGIVTERRRRKNDYDETLVFLGRFEAVVLVAELAIDPAGGIVRGDRACFPAELEQLISAAFPPNRIRANLQIAARIGVGPVPAGHVSSSGYVWVVRSLIPPQESDAVVMLRERLQEATA